MQSKRAMHAWCVCVCVCNSLSWSLDKCMEGRHRKEQSRKACIFVGHRISDDDDDEVTKKMVIRILW